MTGTRPEGPESDVVLFVSQYPIMDWEDAQHRVMLPQSLRLALGVSEPILRWARQKRVQVLEQHAVDVPVVLNIDQHLRDWAFCGRERGATDVWRVVFEVEARWYSLALGRDRTGSLNVITVFGSSSKSFVRNRLRGVESVVQQQR